MKFEITFFRGKKEYFSDKKDCFTSEWSGWFLEECDIPSEYNDDIRHMTISFKKLTTKNKISATDEGFRELVMILKNKNHAKDLVNYIISAQLKKEEETKEDQIRANELAGIINNLPASEMLTGENAAEKGCIIKSKLSRSKWYQHGGQFNQRSQYHTYVAKEVFEQVLKLQQIRSKHQDNPKFDFCACDYSKVTLREADHENWG